MPSLHCFCVLVDDVPVCFCFFFVVVFFFFFLFLNVICHRGTLYCVSVFSRYELRGAVGCGEGVLYLMSPGRPTDIGLQLDEACYPCSR